MTAMIRVVYRGNKSINYYMQDDVVQCSKNMKQINTIIHFHEQNLPTCAYCIATPLIRTFFSSRLYLCSSRRVKEYPHQLEPGLSFIIQVIVLLSSLTTCFQY